MSTSIIIMSEEHPNAYVSMTYDGMYLVRLVAQRNADDQSETVASVKEARLWYEHYNNIAIEYCGD